MPFNWVVGQERVLEVLQRSVAADRVAQAYLFHGPEGSGKRVAALALAQALECERRGPGDGDACGECGPCRKVARMLHPDVRLYLAVPRTHQRSSSGDPGRAQLEDVSARLQLLARDPYTEVGYRRRPDLSDPAKSANLQAFYTVERIREEVNKSLRYTPAEGRYKVVVLTDAETMRAEAANAFLKSLEEPTPRTVIILTATRLDHLLPTIISRCQRVRFESLPAEAIERALVETRGMEPQQAALFSRMADGSFTRALSLANDESLTSRRKVVLNFLREAYRGQARDIDPLIKDLSDLSREQLRDTLVMMLVWLRDILHARELGSAAAIVNVDQEESVRKFADKVPADIPAMADVIERAIEVNAGYTNTTLVLVNLANGLQQAMHGRAGARLF